jgi:hypothetical protein
VGSLEILDVLAEGLGQLPLALGLLISGAIDRREIGVRPP